MPKNPNVYDLVVTKLSLHPKLDKEKNLPGHETKSFRFQGPFIPDYQIIKIKTLLLYNSKKYFILINITCGISFSM